jgi:hypothetical protein
MAIVRITKNRIMKAIKNEPALRPGSWIDIMKVYEKSGNVQVGGWEFMNKVNAKDKECSVCAVGAIMRDILDPTSTARKLDSAAAQATSGSAIHFDSYENDLSRSAIIKRAKEDVFKGRYMNALSVLFEGLGELKGGWESLTPRDIAGLRRSAIAFVKKNFPHSVEIDIDGAKAAKDVKVVRK